MSGQSVSVDFALQALLVRVFKVHRELSGARAAQLAAADAPGVSRAAVDAVLAGLVEREYVERDARSGVYRYVPQAYLYTECLCGACVGVFSCG